VQYVRVEVLLCGGVVRLAKVETEGAVEFGRVRVDDAARFFPFARQQAADHDLGFCHTLIVETFAAARQSTIISA